MADDKIIYFFIEEAKEHLDTLEKGLLDLQSTMADQEMVNELFRAAHSVKGGAAMLGFISIQKAAHRLEDSFKILKENPIEVDQKLESLFLKGYDTLQELVQRLQSPGGLVPEEGEKIVKQAEPVFEELQDYLNRLVSGETGEEDSSDVPRDFANHAIDLLRQMLQLFKQKEDAKNRAALQALCDRLLALLPNNENWLQLVTTSRASIGNPKNSYLVLAPLVIKELKQAVDFLIAGGADFAASPALLSLSGATKGNSLPAGTIALPTEPKAAAKLLLESFDKKTSPCW
ncbi:Hpt domain-containing protein [[Phormidium] sp. ETS-05]|uniref:Hpt domain-containing protein n=1 Tax=[Phormidium] sp. ETS-05 TaxID=222819 RepID=UPI0031FE693A